MEFNVVDTGRIQESFNGIILVESFQLDNRDDENWHTDERYSSSTQNDNYCYHESDNNADIIVANTEMVSNDIEIIAVDPNGDCTEEDEDEFDDNEADMSSVFEEDSAGEDHYGQVTIESVQEALQQSDHHRVYRKSISLPHSPTHYSLDISGISLDDLDLQNHMAELHAGPLIANEVVKSFDLASYITQDDNFEVISPSKVLPNISSNVNNSTSSLPMLHKQMENIELSSLNSGNNYKNNNVISTRRCVISTKKMHYEVPSSASSNSSSSSDSDDELSDSSSNHDNEDVDAAGNDNPKVDPTWCPSKNTRAQRKLTVAKPVKKVKPKSEKVKKLPAKSTSVPNKYMTKTPQKNLLKVCKTTSRTGILNAGAKLTKDKVHKITKSPAGKMVKLDHDYCTFKGKSESIFKSGPQRKAIEIPIMDPAFDKKIRLYKNYVNKKPDTVLNKNPDNGISATKSSTPAGKEQVSLLRANQNQDKHENQDKHDKVIAHINPENDVQNKNKRKLNIAEYMKRREISNALNMLPISLSKNNKTESRPIVDPILAAKHKVLRMQELKKEAKLKEAEPKIENMPILPILPLAEITGTNGNDEMKPTKVLIHPDYEEIIIVSIGSNTDITIPPSEKADNLLSYINDTIKKVQTQDSRVVLNSSSLIVSIQDVVLKKSSAGIQTDIEMQPVMNKAEFKDTEVLESGKDKEDLVKEHGEDKTIMHLRKDRKKPESCSIAIQTIDIPSFSALKRISSKLEEALDKENRIKRQKMYVKRSRSRSMHRRDRNHSEGSHRSTSTRSRSPHCRDRSRDKSRCSLERPLSVESYGRRSRTISGNSTSSTSSSSSNSSGSERSYRSKSPITRRNRDRRCFNSASSRHSSSSYSSRSRSRESLRYKPSPRDIRIDKKKEDPEKRNIVYVGQLEDSITKDNLRKKFLKYGIVRNISLHQKENGMRYGFVTFNKPEEAYSAIDASSKDANLSMYDISFGGRRAFCKAQYADLDGIHSYINYHDIGYPIEPYVPPIRREEKSESFEDMLKKLKQSISARKPTREFNA